MDKRIQESIQKLTEPQKTQLYALISHMASHKEYIPSIRSTTLKKKRMWEYLKEPVAAAAPLAAPVVLLAAPAGASTGPGAGASASTSVSASASDSATLAAALAVRRAAGAAALRNAGISATASRVVLPGPRSGGSKTKKRKLTRAR